MSVTLAVFWGSLWESQCGSLVGQSTDLAVFLDDLSASSNSHVDLVSVVGVTVACASHWEVTLNLSKSCVTLSEAEIRKWPSLEWSLPKQGTWSFLGICLGRSQG